MVCTWTSWESTQVVGPNGPARGHPPRGHVPLIAAAAAGHAGGFSLLPFFGVSRFSHRKSILGFLEWEGFAAKIKEIYVIGSRNCST